MSHDKPAYPPPSYGPGGQGGYYEQQQMGYQQQQGYPQQGGYPPQGDYHQQQGGYYPQQPQQGYYPQGNPPNGNYVQPQQQSSSKDGCLGALLGALACCCCLDCLF